MGRTAWESEFDPNSEGDAAAMARAHEEMTVAADDDPGCPDCIGCTNYTCTDRPVDELDWAVEDEWW
jgi:hypothetical protein